MKDSTYKYVVVSSTFVGVGELRQSYGVAYVDKKLVPIKCYFDLSSDYMAVFELVQLCNRYKMSLLHMEDVIEEFLG